jgi:hypothetical protein
LLTHPVARKRCASCDRWQGPRQPGETPDSVNIEAETDTGLCVGGGWNGDLRRARSACGHWRVWAVLQVSDPD